MLIVRTGHGEIDQQHEMLESYLDQLNSVCSKYKKNQNIRCEQCRQDERQKCKAELKRTVNSLTNFMAGHSSYEEKMMDLLPRKPDCLKHIKGHKAAHQGMMKALRNLSKQVDEGYPLLISQKAYKNISSILGDHAIRFDDPLIKMSNILSVGEAFDNELVTMLDEYVFPNRPTAAYLKNKNAYELKRERIKVRGSFESLTPAQRDVFWLIVNEKKNSEIANELGISVNTVKTHRSAVFRKMNVSSVVELLKKVDVLR